MILTARAPVRIDVAGAWTDVDLYSMKEGGAVVNATINHFISGQVEVADHFDPTDGGDSLNISYRSSLPSGSGLGTSSAMNVCWLSMIQYLMHSKLPERVTLAEMAYDLEQALGVFCGRQDQIAAAVGGINYLTFGESRYIQPITVPEDCLLELESRLVLCYSGKSRLSGHIHDHVWDGFRDGNEEVLTALRSLSLCADEMRDALAAGDLDQVGHVMNENWHSQKMLHESVTNEQLEDLFEVAMDAGAVAGKACGAGGGGCLLFFVEPGAQAEVSDSLKSAGAQPLPFKFVFDGVTVERMESQ
ncbi:MAG: hypothetical protein ABJA67_10625 [Chthonomonadales bacterium]